MSTSDAAVIVVPVPCSLQESDIDCCWTLKASALVTGDAICCLPCCCCCGGCCGRYSPLLAHLAQESIEPGAEACQATCMAQLYAAILVPFTCCLCMWGCCGTATPCARAVAKCVMKVESDHDDRQRQRPRQEPMIR